MPGGKKKKTNTVKNSIQGENNVSVSGLEARKGRNSVEGAGKRRFGTWSTQWKNEGQQKTAQGFGPKSYCRKTCM